MCSSERSFFPFLVTSSTGRLGKKSRMLRPVRSAVAGIQDRIAVFICECEDAVLICGKDALKGIVHDIGHLGTAHFLS